MSTIGNISLGNALVAGKNLVPKPAAGMTAFLTFIVSIPSPKIIIKHLNFPLAKVGLYLENSIV
ncbi:hypothetical protein IV44_GL000408 [Lactobacillus amylovorus DSM 16698]|uniref:Uncharacterized protein n=1 Tax=Lactobacillus amylovorus subsp. animalium DSM 16698 TaxID=695563 RepID=A0A0R2K3A7_LACAM|nr:hypothetical protein IV44_GL000408 [Lactobacillus amylovorus DSM 16698]